MQNLFHASGPSIVAFLHHLSKTRPDLRCFSKLPEEERRRLAHEFCASRTDRWYRESWNRFIKEPSSLGASRASWQSLKNEAEGAQGHCDPLERYLEVPNKAIFLLTSEDQGISDYIRRHWAALHETSGDVLDIYEYAVQYKPGYQSFTRRYVEDLRAIPGVSVDAVLDAGLPCILLWSRHASVILSLADIGNDEVKIRERLRAIFRILPRDTGLTEWQVDELQSLQLNLASCSDASINKKRADPCDVFLSYRRKDVELMHGVRRVIEGAGLKTWHDAAIPCGERFRARIRAQIEEAASTVVCLTREAANSPWVLLEASLAMQLGTIMPLAFDLPQPPALIAAYNVLQADPADLSPGNAVMRALVDQIRERVRRWRRPARAVHDVIGEAGEKLDAFPNVSAKEATRQVRRLKNYARTNPNVDSEGVRRLLDSYERRLAELGRRPL